MQYRRQYCNTGMEEVGKEAMIRSANLKLNELLHGGLLKGVVTQMYGEAGSGKTQIAMLFTLGALLTNTPAIYLCTQKELSWVRYTQLAYTVMNEAEFDARQSNLLLKKCTDFSEAYHFVEESFKIIKQKGRGGILVIDSVYSLLKSCFQFHQIEEDNYARSRRQSQFVNRIRWLAKMSHTAVLLINHASDSMEQGLFRRNSGKGIIAALGPSWQLQMDQNIMVTRKRQVREISIIHSPKCPVGTKGRFRIQTQGIVWVSEEGLEDE